MDTSGDRHPGVAKKGGVLVFGETLFAENPCVSILPVTSELRETSLGGFKPVLSMAKESTGQGRGVAAGWSKLAQNVAAE
jgi:hypothetical protein